MSYEQPLITTLIVSSVISVLASSSVLLTLLVFPKMRAKTFMQVIAFVSIGDTLGNIPYIFPFRPGTGNPWCSTQAFFNLTGYPIGWCWTVVLVYLLYCLGALGRMPNTLLPFHIVCWIVPLTVSLTTLAYSKFYGPHGVDTCSINTTPTAVTAHIAIYFGLLFFCIGTISALLIRLYQLQRNRDPNVCSIAFQKAKNTLQLYPIAMIIFWFPHLFTELLLLFGYYKYRIFLLIYYIFVVLKIFHGFAAAMIFFVRSNEARTLWSAVIRRLLVGKFRSNSEESEESLTPLYDDHDAEAIIRERGKEFSVSRDHSSEVQLSFNAILFPDGPRLFSNMVDGGSTSTQSTPKEYSIPVDA